MRSPEGLMAILANEDLFAKPNLIPATTLYQPFRPIETPSFVSREKYCPIFRHGPQTQCWQRFFELFR
jgi:hypothetical protein